MVTAQIKSRDCWMKSELYEGNPHTLIDSAAYLMQEATRILHYHNSLNLQ
jgi:hypothetical protein